MSDSAADARTVAARAVERVLADAAFAAAVLDAELDTAALPVRERALATEITYGVLRTRAVLEQRIREQAARNVKASDHFLRAHLLVAAYQILLLDRVPAFAAVDAAVRAVKKKRGPRVAGFVNAVCRALARAEPLDRESAVLDSAPPWLRDELVSAVGEAEARALLGATQASVPPAAVRLVRGAEIPAWLEDSQPGAVSPRARRLSRRGDLRKRPGYAEGAFVVQEEGAQVIGLLLGARAGERVLDVCAGRGQKTSLLAEQVGPSGTVWATDLYPAKLDALRRELQRLHLPAPEIRAVDFTRGTADVPADFDRVLVDAPCTGVGTLARRPEIALRLTPEDPPRLAGVAEQILRHAATRVRPGSGRLVFAVCSVLRAECEDVVDRVADVLAPAPFDAPELSVPSPDATSFRLLPGAHETDGYFVASFVRRA
jgi:16S rRNA (cytosine967-C5)-methyltransferase